MALPRFEYRPARSVDEALALWSEKPGARYLAGGTDLLPQMRTGRRSATRLVDVKGIAVLEAIRHTNDGGLAIGAGVPLSVIAAHRGVREGWPLVADCAFSVGAHALRNRATLVGNICNASPAADTAAALLLVEAKAVVRGVHGTRTLPVTGFFAGPGATALQPGELVLEVLLPAGTRWQGSYLRLSRRRGMDLATVGVAVGCARKGSEARHRVSLVAVAPVPLRVREAEETLDREGPGAAAKAAEAAREACRPITDVRGTAQYRREMVGVLVKRGLDALQEAR